MQPVPVRGIGTNYPMRPDFWSRAMTRIGIFIACTALQFAAGCQRTNEPLADLKIEHEISPQPARVGPVTVTLSVTDTSSRPVSGLHLKMEADMSHPGMSPVFADAAETQPGRYQSQLSLGMAGDWVVLVHGTLGGRKVFDQQFDISGVRPK